MPHSFIVTLPAFFSSIVSTSTSVLKRTVSLSASQGALIPVICSAVMTHTPAIQSHIITLICASAWQDLKLVTHAERSLQVSKENGECMAPFLKMDGECAGCALGVVCAYIPEDVQMQICIYINLYLYIYIYIWVTKSVLSSPVWNSIQESSCWVDDLSWPGRWRACSLPLVFPVVIISHDLLLFVPGVSADTLVWLPCTVLGTTLQTATSESNVTEASWHFGKEKKHKITLENICCSPEKNPPPDWVMFYGRKAKWLLHQVTDDADELHL